MWLGLFVAMSMGGLPGVVKVYLPVYDALVVGWVEGQAVRKEMD